MSAEGAKRKLISQAKEQRKYTYFSMEVCVFIFRVAFTMRFFYCRFWVYLKIF